MRHRPDIEKAKAKITSLLRHGSLNGSALTVVMRSEKFTKRQVANALKELESENKIKKINVRYNYKLLGNIISTHKCANCIRGDHTLCISLNCDCECSETDTCKGADEFC